MRERETEGELPLSFCVLLISLGFSASPRLSMEFMTKWNNAYGNDSRSCYRGAWRRRRGVCVALPAENSARAWLFTVIGN